MPKEDIQISSERASDDSPTVSPSLKSDEVQTERKEDEQSVSVEKHPDSQLFHRRSDNRESDKKINSSKENLYHQGDSSPATLDVGELQTVTLGHVNKLDVLKDENGGVFKGVVLNASQLYRPRDVRWVSDNLGGDETKDHELTQNYLVAGNQVEPTGEKKPSAERETADLSCSEMTLLRKIVFGFSFIPSILFVLCFAVILPCEEPPLCIKDLWSITINDTAFSPHFFLTDQELLISSSINNTKLSSLSRADGKEIWNNLLPSTVVQVDCNKFISIHSKSINYCVAMTEEGILYSFNMSNGFIFWNFTLPTRDVSKFAILSDCDNDGIQEIAIAVSLGEIYVITNGSLRLPEILIEDCTTTPTDLMAWSQNGTTALIYNCKTKSGSEVMRLLNQENWCPKEKNLKAEHFDLLDGSGYQNLKDTLRFPTINGLVALAEDLLILFDCSGNRTWSKIVPNHLYTRHLFFGKFLSDEKEDIVIINGDSADSSVILLDGLSGNETGSFNLSDTRAAIMINGKKKDSLLVVLKEIQTKSLGEINSSSDLSLTTVNPTVGLLPSVDTKYSLVLLEFQNTKDKLTLHKRNIRTEQVSQNEDAIRLAAAAEENYLKIFTGRTSISPSDETSLVIQAVEVDYWNDTSDTSHCK